MSAAVAAPPARAQATQVFDPSLGRAEWAALGVLVAAAILVRAVHWWQTSLMFNDGPTFLRLAQEMAAGRWSDALGHPYHPLYPFLTRLVHLAVPDWERAAALVSIVSGGAAVGLVFVFLRSAFGARAAWLGAALLSVQPRLVSSSADVQSDGLYLALFLAAVACVWFALQQRSAAWAGCAGLLSGLAYLTRPEGLGVALVAGMAAALRCLRGEWRIGSAAAWSAALLASLLLVVVPYVAAMRAESGEWRLTGKKPVTSLLAFEDRVRAAEEAEARARTVHTPAPASTGVAVEPDASPAETALPASPLLRFARSAGRIAAAVSSGVRPWFLALLLAGAVARRGRPGPGAELVLLLLGLHAVVAFAQLLHEGYLDVRHVLPPLVPAFGYFAPGLDAMARGLARLALRGGAPAPAWCAGALAAIALLAGLGQSLRPDGAGARAERAAADWLRAHAAAEGAVAAPKSRLAYYAGRPAVVLYHAPAHAQLAWLRAQGARYVILDDRGFERFPELRAARGIELALLYCARERDHWAAAYELRAPDSPAIARPDGDAACAGAPVAVGAAAQARGAN